MPNLRLAPSRALAAVASAAAVTITAAAPVGAASPASGERVFAIAAVLSGARDDHYINESVTDSLEALRDGELVAGHEYDYAIATPDPAAAADQIMQFGSEPWGVVLVAGPYEEAVLEAAAANPQRAFVFAPTEVPVAELELPENVSMITPDAAEGGAVLAAIANEMTAGRVRVLANEVEGVTPPGQLFNDAFVESVGSSVTVDIAAPLGDLGQVDLLVVNRQLSAGEASEIASRGTPLLGNASDQSGFDGALVASSVYRWDVPLRDIIGRLAGGDLGGDVHHLDLAGGGLEIRIGDGAAGRPGVDTAADAAITAIAPPTTAPPATTAAPAITAPPATDSNPTTPPPPGTEPAAGPPAPAPPTAAPTTPPPPAPPTAAPTNPPAPSAGDCQGLGVGTANDWRANEGVAALAAAGLGACSWARQMASSQSMSHAGGQPGEVVYSGGSCGGAWTAWSGSGAHYSLIVSANYSQGDFQCVVDSNGVAWAVGRLSW